MRKPIAGISCLSQDPEGNIVGNPYPSERGNLRDFVYKQGTGGDHWGCLLTEVARKYPYPEVKGFIPEGYIWLRIAEDYDDLWINEPLRIYHSGEPDALSRSRLKLTVGNILYARRMIKRDWRYFPWAPLRFLRAALAALIPFGFCR